MAIASIANIPQDSRSLLEFSFAHMAHHRDLNDYIFQTKGISLPLFPIDPINQNDLGTFGYQHQLMHNNQNEILGIVGNDLLNVDLNDPEQRAAWTWLNFTEHLQAANITGVG